MTVWTQSRRVALGGLALAMVAGMSFSAQAQDAASFPNKPIRIIVPFAAGGGNDIFARLVGQKAGDILGQQLIIENRPAAGGRPAAEYVTQQPADGYTLFVGASGVMSIASAIYPKLPYHPTRDFIPLSMIASFPLIIASNAAAPPKSIKDLVEYAKANPNKANYASSSPAFTIPTELLKLKTGMPAVNLPVKSSMEMVQCVLQDNCLFTVTDGPPAIPQIKDGRLRGLAVTGSERSPELPDVPSMAEAGYPEVNSRIWSGFFAAKGTPPAIAKKLEEAFSKAIRDPEVSAKLRAMAVNPGGGPSEDFRKLIDSDIETYTKIVKDAKLTFE